MQKHSIPIALCKKVHINQKRHITIKAHHTVPLSHDFCFWTKQMIHNDSFCIKNKIWTLCHFHLPLRVFHCSLPLGDHPLVNLGLASSPQGLGYVKVTPTVRRGWTDMGEHTKGPIRILTYGSRNGKNRSVSGYPFRNWHILDPERWSEKTAQDHTESNTVLAKKKSIALFYEYLRNGISDLYEILNLCS